MIFMGRGLDLSKLDNRKKIPMSTAEALKDVTPIEWSKKVMSGEKKVTVCGAVR
jgi:hypothetical protein